MSLSLNSNCDTRISDRYEIARTLYAETDGGKSLRAVEALASMIRNAATMRECAPIDIVRDPDMFASRNQDNPRHCYHRGPQTCAAFQMCLRVAHRMQSGHLPDMCCGATRFHHDGPIPSWATSRGYIADICGMLFYL